MGHHCPHHLRVHVGAGARDGVLRTVFAVGDEKQSIFSFQGAAPRELLPAGGSSRRSSRTPNLDPSPSHSLILRSGHTILKSVDHVFRDEAIYRSIHAENAYPLHEALPDAGLARSTSGSFRSPMISRTSRAGVRRSMACR